jgi:SpoVK/Ycf46/Vps4 family AAA+-type ATPase
MYSVTLLQFQIFQIQKYLKSKDFKCFHFEYIENEIVPSTGEYTFGDFTITFKEEGKPRGDPPNYFRRMIISHPTSQEELERFLKEAFTSVYKTQTIKVYNCSRHGFWSTRPEVIAQNIEHIFIPKEMKNDITKMVDEFIQNKERYTKFGRMYKIGFLFTGVPGSGKTSLVKSIALKHQRPVYTISFSRSLTEEKLFDLVHDMKDDSILLLEDIDSFFVERKPEESTCVSFSALINILDGVLSNGNGIMTFMTANDPKLLDKALIRPGRIDKIVHFDYPKKSEIKEAFMHLTDGKDFESFYENIKNKRISMSGIIDYLFRNESTYVKNIDSLAYTQETQSMLYN